MLLHTKDVDNRKMFLHLTNFLLCTSEYLKSTSCRVKRSILSAGLGTWGQFCIKSFLSLQISLRLTFNSSFEGDNPVMIAAKLRHKDLVSDVLRSSKFVNTEPTYLEQFIHSRNKYGQTLLHMVALQGPELEEQKLLILRKEIEIHCIR